MDAQPQAKTVQPLPLTNEQVAGELDEVADLLEGHGANSFRVRAYRNAAESIRKLDVAIVQLAEDQGVDGLMQLPAIGRSLAHTLAHLAHSGRLPMLERLHGENAPERLFTTVADIGPKLAQRIHEELGIETLSELSAAAHDGRLARVRGMGGKRVQAVREALAGRFRQGSSPHPAPARREPERVEPPPLEELLDIDREYRQLARQGKLPRIAPRRFNPTNEAWLPVLHTEREGRHYTALYSNTARAHELGTTHDWVVIYCDDDQRGGSWTAITASYGPLRGRRVIRGREDECARHYALEAGPATRRLVQKRFPF
ncbi:MAG: helix-hairpin-helix domain-containing protein [Pirellulaceae bacterium]|jgi:putative hydrolase|nr:helix-hairpin-helix domain-containing protein [Pirellulaceae bacterium]